MSRGASCHKSCIDLEKQHRQTQMSQVCCQCSLRLLLQERMRQCCQLHCCCCGSNRAGWVLLLLPLQPPA